MSQNVFQFEFNNNHIYFQGRINNRAEPFWFILDTCAGSTLLNARLTKELGLNVQPASNFVAFGAGQGGPAPAGFFVKDVRLGLGSLSLHFPTIGAIPLNGLEAHEGRSVDGIIGYELFSKFVTSIDYTARLFRLFDPRTYSYAGQGETIPFQMMFERLPLIDIAVLQHGRGPVTGKALVDTGASLALGLAKSFTETHGLLRSAPRTLPAQIGLGVSGHSNGLLARVTRLRLGQLEIDNFIGSFSQDTEGVFKLPGLAGLIGGEILRRFTAVFDFPRQRIFLEPNTSFNDPFDYDMSGALLMAAGTNFSELQIHRVVRHSPAAEAGLRAGDVIVSLEGRPASTITLEQARSMFKQGGRAFTLGINRSGERQQFTVRLKLRNLI